MGRRCGVAWALVFGLAKVATAMADSDIAVEKSVNDPTLMPGAAVEFEVRVSNLGPDPADAVVVTDELPTGLAIPSGTVPVANPGTYDPTTGTWEVGTLAAGAEAVLTIPAQVTAEPLPVCIANRAVATAAGTAAGVDPDLSNNLSIAALRQVGETARCVDLSIGVTRFGSILGCGDESVEIGVLITNLGADAATDVVLKLEDGPNVPPGLIFVEESCGGGMACTVTELPAGTWTYRTLRTSGIRNSRPVTYDVTVSASSADPDVATGNESDSVSFTKEPYTECNFPNIFDSGGGGGGCFIATAAYGSPMHPYVEVLRNWRDRVLLTNAAGRAFVNLYYRYSPPWADYIAGRPGARSVVRILLWPLVIAILHPLLVGTIVLVVTIGLIFRRRRRLRVA